MGKKGDARITREVNRRLKEKDKSARLVERIKSELPQAKQPRLGASPSSIMQMLMEWTDEEADREGQWSWGPRDWTDEAWAGVIKPKLASFETMKWYEIEAAVTGTGHHMHHSMEIEQICDECQSRLLKLEKVDGDIYRFRLGNKRRLWGFRIAKTFEVLWYDPEHNVYPTDPD